MELLRKNLLLHTPLSLLSIQNPSKESGLERFSLINTKNTVQNMYGNIFSNPLFIPMKNWMTILGRRNYPHWSGCVQIWILYNEFKGTVLFDEVIGCYVDEENEGSQIF